MRTPKELLAGLLERRWVAHGSKDSTQDSSKDQRKVVYFVFTDKIEAARQEYISLAKVLSQSMEYASSTRITGPSPKAEGLDPAACTVHFSSKSGAKKAAQFLADIYGFWRGNHSEAEDIGSYHVHDKAIRCEIDHVCYFFDPNGFMDFSFTDNQVERVVSIDKDQHQFAKRYLDVLSSISDQGIVPDWPYDKDDCELIWETHQARVNLLRLILSSCIDKKPHPAIQKSYRVITFKPDDDDFDILMDGELLSKFTSAARRAILALALQRDLAAIDMEDFCNAWDPPWANDKSRLKKPSQKFSQAIQSLRRKVPGLNHEPIGAGRARVDGIMFGDKPSAAKLKKQISNVERVSRG
jgi:hypothetical protein